jgi:hypothetical protein
LFSKLAIAKNSRRKLFSEFIKRNFWVKKINENETELNYSEISEEIVLENKGITSVVSTEGYDTINSFRI